MSAMAGNPASANSNSTDVYVSVKPNDFEWEPLKQFIGVGVKRASALATSVATQWANWQA